MCLPCEPPLEHYDVCLTMTAATERFSVELYLCMLLLQVNQNNNNKKLPSRYEGHFAVLGLRWLTHPHSHGPLNYKANLHESWVNEGREEKREPSGFLSFFFFWSACSFQESQSNSLPSEKPWVSGGEFIGTVLKRRAPERDLMLRCGAPGPRPGTSSTDQRLSQRRKGWRETYAKFALFFNFSMSGLHSACLEDVWPLSLWTPYMPLGPQAKWLVYESNG